VLKKLPEFYRESKGSGAGGPEELWLEYDFGEFIETRL
jgi:hypothetical protein